MKTKIISFFLTCIMIFSNVFPVYAVESNIEEASSVFTDMESQVVETESQIDLETIDASSTEDTTPTIEESESASNTETNEIDTSSESINDSVESENEAAENMPETDSGSENIIQNSNTDVIDSEAPENQELINNDSSEIVDNKNPDNDEDSEKNKDITAENDEETEDQISESDDDDVKLQEDLHDDQTSPDLSDDSIGIPSDFEEISSPEEIVDVGSATSSANENLISNNENEVIQNEKSSNKIIIQSWEFIDEMESLQWSEEDGKWVLALPGSNLENLQADDLLELLPSSAKILDYDIVTIYEEDQIKADSNITNSNEEQISDNETITEINESKIGHVEDNEQTNDDGEEIIDNDFEESEEPINTDIETEATDIDLSAAGKIEETVISDSIDIANISEYEENENLDLNVLTEIPLVWDLSSLSDKTESEFYIYAEVDDPYEFEDSLNPSIYLIVGGANLYSMTLPSGTPPFSEHQITGTTPMGTTIDLFDYWIDDQNTSDNVGVGSDFDFYMNGINKDHVLLFGSGMSNQDQYGAWNVWTGSSGGVRSGLVSNTLGDDGYPFLNIDQTSISNLSLPGMKSRSGAESLKYLFDNTSFDGKKAYTNVRGFLRTDAEGYYYYDCNSTNNGTYAVYYENLNSFVLYDQWGVNAGGSSPNGQFFPFTDPSVVFNNYYQRRSINSTNASINHYFGMHMSSKFVQQDGGTIRNQPITYEFSGDDDVWIFIDGVLVADLGGIHNMASLNINFQTGEIEIDGKSAGTIRSKFEEAGADVSGFSCNTFADDTYHTLDFYYLERGNTDSNLSLKFNIITIPESTLIKVDQTGAAVEGAEFAIYSEEDLTTPLATGTTNAQGEFVFMDINKSDHEYPLTVEQLYERVNINENTGEKYHLILRETLTPQGYRKVGDAELYFWESANGEILLLSENTYETGAYAQSKALITAPDIISVNGSNVVINTDNNRGILFAIVSKKVNGVWYPVYGNALEGWEVLEDDSISSIITAARACDYIFAHGNNGNMQVLIEQLPGDIRDYYYMMDEENRSDALYTVNFYYSYANTLDLATASNTYLVDRTISGNDTFQKQFSVDLYVPNIKNTLYVQKVDEEGNPVVGAVIDLYTSVNVIVSDTGEISLKENAVPYDTVTTQEESSSNFLDGGAAFPSADKLLETGVSYYIKERTAPNGYILNEEIIPVVIDNSGIYADAGDNSDGISVLRGVGSIVRSVLQFATDDGINTTLNQIKATIVTSEDFNTWTEANWTDALHLTFKNSYQVLDYGLTDGPDGSLDTLCFEQETGWSKLLIRQCLEHNSPNQDSVKEILGDQDITLLFSGTVIVRIENQRAADLKISKEVVDPNGSGVDFSDKEFFFTIELYDYENDTSLNESYTVTKYKDDGSGVLVEIESNIIQHGDSISLCDGEWVIIKNLPLGTYYQVTELPASGFTTYVSDHPYGHYDENSVISNTIEINNTEYLAAFRNSYNYTAPVEYGSITVSKTVTGNLGDQTKEFHFRLELSHDTEVIPDALSYVKGTDTGVIEKESDGVFIFTLAHGDTIIIQGIPLGSIYDIKETDGESSGYTITSRNASGTILGDINALFINTRHGVIPSAANTPAYSLLLSGGGICLIFAYFIYKRLKNISKK